MKTLNLSEAGHSDMRTLRSWMSHQNLLHPSQFAPRRIPQTSNASTGLYECRANCARREVAEGGKYTSGSYILSLASALYNEPQNYVTDISGAKSLRVVIVLTCTTLALIYFDTVCRFPKMATVRQYMCESMTWGSHSGVT